MRIIVLVFFATLALTWLAEKEVFGSVVSANTAAGIAGTDKSNPRRTRKRQKKTKEPKKTTKNDSSSTNSTDRFIVKYKTRHGKKEALKMASDVYYDYDNLKTVVVGLDSAGVETLSTLSTDIVAVDKDTLMTVPYVVGDSFHQGQGRHLTQITPYGIPMVQADKVRVPKKLSTRKTVCLVDTGVLYTHPDLPQSLMTGANRFSTTYNEELYWQLGVDGHGTCLAGILSANMTNDIGIRGVGDIPLYITRGMNDQGEAMQSDILGALSQCEESGAQIISLSFGGGGISTTFADLLNHLYDDLGILILASSGNNGQEYAMYPAAYSRVISVGAVNASGEHWFASDWGPSLELMAPGDNVWCTSISNGQPSYALYSGTSMASPYAAGVAALVWSHFPTCTNSQIRYTLSKTAKDIGAPGCDQITGNGIVQALAAFDFLHKNPCKGASWGLNITTSIGCDVVA